MGCSASVAPSAGAVAGRFRQASTGIGLTVNYTEQARLGGKEVEAHWLNVYTFLVNEDDSDEAQLFAYSYIKDGFVCLVNRYGRRAMASAYQEDDGFRRQKGMCEKAPEVHRCKQTVGYFRGLSIPEMTYNDLTIHGEPAKVQWLNPCTFRTAQGGKRAPELWVYIKSKDAFMQVVVGDRCVTEAREDNKRMHTRLSPAEAAKAAAAAAAANGPVKLDSPLAPAAAAGGDKQEPAPAAKKDDAAATTGDAVAMGSRLASTVETLAEDGCFEHITNGRYTGPEGEVRVTHKSAKVFGKKKAIKWLSPYTFVCSMEEGEGGGRQHMWIYSMDFQGLYQVTEAADSLAQTYAGAVFYQRAEGELPAELLLVEKRWGRFEGLTVPEDDGPITLRGSSYGLDWLNPFAFHFQQADGQDHFLVYDIEKKMYLELGPWENSVGAARSKAEHQFKSLDKDDEEEEDAGGEEE